MSEDRSLSFDFTPKAPQPLEEPPPPLTVAELDRAIKGALDGAFDVFHGRRARRQHDGFSLCSDMADKHCGGN